GTRGAPKFPQAMSCDYLLRRWARTGDESLLEMVAHTFRAMARGGIYDQVGGGFHRYAVDAIWLVPHFEKMLYDNALLARLGVHLWQATGDREVRRVTEETLRWVAREMTRPGASEAGDDAALAESVRRAKAALLVARSLRVRPARDEKILAMWNGIMLRAVAEAARAFESAELRTLAIRNGEFLASTLVHAESGRVM